MRVDYLTGYKCAALVRPHKTKAPEETWLFGLVFDGGYEVRFYDHVDGTHMEIPKESQVQNKILLSVSNNFDGSCEVKLGIPSKPIPGEEPSDPDVTCVITANMARYTIVDPNRPDIEWQPVLNPVEVALPDDPSEHRVVEAPQSPEEAAQEPGQEETPPEDEEPENG